jgi:molecular chaperone HscB
VSACWKCHEATGGGPVCVSCGTIQPPSPDPDLFALLGLRRTFRIDLEELDHRFRETSRLVHPDRFAKAPAVERRMSLQWTAAVNAARRVLKDPVQRAHYLATGSAQMEESGPKVGAAFLEEMFELNERAAEAPDGVRAEAEQRRGAAWRELEAIFDEHEAGRGTLDEVEERLARIRYLDNLLVPH